MEAEQDDGFDLSAGHDVVLLMVNWFGCFPRKMVYLISTASMRIHGASLK